jgi:Xaa-Pro aminopeptidase
MLAAFEAAVAPGVRERELLAVLADTMLRGGGEHLATSTICSGPNGNPWRSEATDRAPRDGELVYVDTDTVGVEGYFSCVSRTLPFDGRLLA